MILTGKAKHDFENWLTKGMSGFAHNMEIDFFNQKSEIEKNALIIEWFDSVMVYITIEGVFDRMLGYHRGFEIHIYQYGKQSISIFSDNDVFYTRQEATKEAIIKANEIYNNM